MADTPTQSPLFLALAKQYGFRTALALLPILNNDSSTASKAFAGTSLAGTGANVAGKLSGTPALSSLGQGIGSALGLATTGYNIAGIAKDDDLSTKQKAAHSGGAAADLIFSYLFPIYGAAKALSGVGQYLSRSGSPQVRGAGRALDYAAEPAGAKSFLDVLRADKSPKAAFNAQGGPKGLVLDMLGPLGIIARGTGTGDKVAKGIMDYGPLAFGGKALSMLGFGSKPTTGTQFRDQVEQLFNKIPALKGTDTSKYNMEGGVDAYNAFSPEARQRAEAIAAGLVPMASAAKGNPSAYQGQLANILLNRFGNGITGLQL